MALLPHLMHVVRELFWVTGEVRWISLFILYCLWALRLFKKVPVECKFTSGNRRSRPIKTGSLRPSILLCLVYLAMACCNLADFVNFG